MNGPLAVFETSLWSYYYSTSATKTNSAVMMVYVYPFPWDAMKLKTALMNLMKNNVNW